MILFKSKTDKNTALKTEAFTSALDLGTSSDVILTYPIGSTGKTELNPQQTCSLLQYLRFTTDFVLLTTHYISLLQNYVFDNFTIFIQFGWLRDV